jgi:hypothetical protein
MLLKWAAIDNDRTMLFGAELRVRMGEDRPSFVSS